MNLIVPWSFLCYNVPRKQKTAETGVYNDENKNSTFHIIWTIQAFITSFILSGLSDLVCICGEKCYHTFSCDSCYIGRLHSLLWIFCYSIFSVVRICCMGFLIFWFPRQNRFLQIMCIPFYRYDCFPSDLHFLSKRSLPEASVFYTSQFLYDAGGSVVCYGYGNQPVSFYPCIQFTGGSSGCLWEQRI